MKSGFHLDNFMNLMYNSYMNDTH